MKRFAVLFIANFLIITSMLNFFTNVVNVMPYSVNISGQILFAKGKANLKIKDNAGDIVLINGKKVQIDSSNAKVTPIIKNDRTMLPIRFVAESIGAHVNWYQTDKSILIVYPKE
ncbi:MAG: hypothetical protein JHC30_08430 [Caldisericum sp.]|nr:hypothetical protein [Caldisericum sp.]